MSDLDAQGVADGTERRLLVVPPDPAELEVVVVAESAGCGCGDSPVHQDQFRRSATPCRVRSSSISSLARFSWVEADTTSAATGRPVTSNATTRFAPLVRP